MIYNSEDSVDVYAVDVPAAIACSIERVFGMGVVSGLVMSYQVGTN